MNDSPEHFTEPITLQRQRGINILPQETFLKKYHPASIHFAEGDMAYVYEDTANPDFVIKKAQRGKDFCMLTEAVAIERITGKSVDVTFTNARYDIEIAVPRINGSKVSQQAIHKVENGERVFVKSVGEAILNAHRKGVVARDIKYDQFLIKEDGTAELIDYSSGMIWPDIDTEQLAMFKRQVEAIDSYVNWHSKISTNKSAVIKKFCEDFDKVFGKDKKLDDNFDIQHNEVVRFFQDSYSALLPIFGSEKYKAMMKELNKDILPEVRVIDLRPRKVKDQEALVRKTEILRRKAAIHDSLVKWRNLVAETQKILGVQTGSIQRTEDFNLSNKAAQYVSDKTSQFLGFSDASLEASFGFPITYNLPSSIPTDIFSRYEPLKNQLSELQRIYVIPNSQGTGSIKFEEILETYRKNYLIFLINDWRQMLEQIESIKSNGQIKNTYITMNLFKSALENAQKQLEVGQLDAVANLDETIKKYLPR